MKINRRTRNGEAGNKICYVMYVGAHVQFVIICKLLQLLFANSLRWWQKHLEGVCCWQGCHPHHFHPYHSHLLCSWHLHEPSLPDHGGCSGCCSAADLTAYLLCSVTIILHILVYTYTIHNMLVLVVTACYGVTEYFANLRWYMTLYFNVYVW